MNNQRRQFLNQVSLMAGVFALNKPLTSLASVSKHVYSLHSAESAVTIYHTNDLRGQFNAAYKNMGGIDNLKTLLAKQEINGLLLDAGNFLNSADSFRSQKDIVRTMNNMGYVVASPGSNELANGQDHLASLVPLMKFKLVNCNYTFDSALSRSINPYIIITSGNYKIGVTGVGPKLHGVVYNDAIASANKAAAILKTEEKCDIVICMSQLPHKAKGSVDNITLLKKSENIDMIIGGNSRKLTAGPMIVNNKLGRSIILTNTASEGLMAGRTVFNFDKEAKQNKTISAKYFIPGQPEDEAYKKSLSLLNSRERAA